MCFSYLEIYNERPRDLLLSSNARRDEKQHLRVREHPRTGPYVQGLNSAVLFQRFLSKMIVEAIGKLLYFSSSL